ncbi:MAG: hypothetical protein QM278_05635 [Pseudomonadota bacterium]|nr:hypothetical protein [Pseudomonadota bacterium]
MTKRLQQEFCRSGARVGIENPAIGKVVETTVTDHGQFIRGGDVDPSHALARRPSPAEKVVGGLSMRVL